MHVVEMKRELKKLTDEARAILDEAGDTGMTEDQEKRYDAGMGQIDELRGRIRVEEERQRWAMEEGAPVDSGKQPEKRSFGEFLQMVQRNDPALAQETRGTASGGNIATPADGGYLIEPEVSSELLRLGETHSVLLPMVRHVPMSTSNTLKFKMIKETSREDSSRNGGVTAHWIGEADKYTQSKPQYDEISISLQKLTGLTYLTDELLEDAAAAEAIVKGLFAEEFAYKCDDAIAVGTGAGMPLGYLTTGTNGNKALITVAKETGQAAKTVNMQNILKMWNALPAKNRSKAAWVINQDVEIQLYQMLMQNGTVAAGDASVLTGVPVFLPPNGLADKPFAMLLGRPVIPIEQASALGSVGDISFVDLSQYLWIEKGGTRLASSIHVRFDYDETAFKFTYRANGRPLWQSPLKSAKGGTERSPYVALAARA